MRPAAAMNHPTHSAARRLRLFTLRFRSRHGAQVLLPVLASSSTEALVQGLAQLPGLAAGFSARPARPADFAAYTAGSLLDDATEGAPGEHTPPDHDHDDVDHEGGLDAHFSALSHQTPRNHQPGDHA